MDYTNFCICLCNEVSELFHSYKEHVNEIKIKDDRDVATKLDEKIEHYVKTKIKEVYPEHEIIGEELGETRSSSDYQWIIDPIDGTVNFINELEFYAFSIALKHKNKTIVGAVHNYCDNTTYHAVKDSGSFINGKKIEPDVRSTKPTVNLAISLLLPNHFSSEIKKKNIELLHLLYENCLSVRVMTCHSLEIIYTALGKFDATICIKTRGISSAGALLFLKELSGDIFKCHYTIENKDVYGLIACNKNATTFLENAINQTNGTVKHHFQ